MVTLTKAQAKHEDLQRELTRQAFDRFTKDAFKVMAHIKALSLSGDMQAAKLFCDFMFGKPENREVEGLEPSVELTNEQAIEIAKIAGRVNHDAK